MNTTAVYVQSTGKLYLPDGTTIDAGSGKRNKNGQFQPDAQFVKKYGPIPVGMWNIAKPAPHTYKLRGGKKDTTLSLYLDPQNATGGRGGFFMHHPHSRNLQSIGCVVMNDAAVKKVAEMRREGKLTQLKVVRNASFKMDNEMKETFDDKPSKESPRKLKDLAPEKDKTKKFKEKLKKTPENKDVPVPRHKPWYQSKFSRHDAETGEKPKPLRTKKKKQQLAAEQKQKKKKHLQKQKHKKHHPAAAPKTAHHKKTHHRKKHHYRIKHPKALKHHAPAAQHKRNLFQRFIRAGQ